MKTISITLPCSPRVGGELYCLTHDLFDDTNQMKEGEANWHRARFIAANKWNKKNLRLIDCPVDTAEWLIGELEYFGDPAGGWDDEARFRFRPFQRMAHLIREAIAAQ